MTYCPECGKEVDEEAAFCPSCGANMKERGVTYRRPAISGWGVARVMAALIGGLMIVASIAMMVGGGGIFWFQRNFGTPEGFLTTGEFRLQTDSHAMVVKGIDIRINLPSDIWRPRLGELATIRIVGTSKYPSKGVFIGIAPADAAEAYLRDVEYDQLSDFDWSYDPIRRSRPEFTYTTHPGSAPSSTPDSEAFWEASATGLGTQTLEWELRSGSYWVVAMNADGSSGVDMDVELGARVPILRTISNALLAGGFITLVIGAVIVYYGVIRRL